MNKRANLRCFYCFNETHPCGRWCEEKSHQPEDSVPLTSTEVLPPPPTHTKVESGDLQEGISIRFFFFFLNKRNKELFPFFMKYHSLVSVSEGIIARWVREQN